MLKTSHHMQIESMIGYYNCSVSVYVMGGQIHSHCFLSSAEANNRFQHSESDKSSGCFLQMFGIKYYFFCYQPGS